jgi:hypothetical protein
MKDGFVPHIVTFNYFPDECSVGLEITVLIIDAQFPDLYCPTTRVSKFTLHRFYLCLCPAADNQHTARVPA